MAGQTFAHVARKIELVAKELDGGSMRERLDRVGKQSTGDIDAAVRGTSAVRGTLGDQSMSGWKRSGPIEIKGAHRVVGDQALFLSAGKASGQMRVLQSGRHQGDAGGMAGPGQFNADGGHRVSSKGKIVNSRRRKGYALGKVGKRWNGTTRGKGTWDVAAASLAENVPKRVAAEVHKAIGKHISGG